MTLGAGEAAAATAIVDRGIAAYFARRRAMVPAFVERNYSWRGALALHRVALGWDILRAPANLTLAGPQLLLSLVPAFRHRSLLLKTAVVREIEWRVMTELLELPYAQGARRATTDALAAAILADAELGERVAAALDGLGARAADPALRARLEANIAAYTETRAAAAEITTGLLTLSSGALALQKLTPGAVTLGPALAGVLAQQAAIAAFPLGSGLGGLWYGAFPAAPSAGLVAGLTGGLMLAAAATAAFAGIVADPIQRHLGLHGRRLEKMLDGLERQMRQPGARGFAARDRYVARLMDLFDILGAAARALHA